MNELQSILNEVKKAVKGKDQILLWILMTLLAEGNILLEDIPGVGKTTIALAFSKALGLQYGRVQFNPDVMPSDVTGYSVYNKQTGQMQYQPGAVLCNLFLADELNRASSRTQSALLEAMEEGQVTVDGVSHRLPRPFSVIATQNPTGAAGTQLLPDSQMDRFTVRLSVGYPDAKAETEMLLSRQGGAAPLGSVSQVVTAQQFDAMRQKAAQIYMKNTLAAYIVRLVNETRRHPLVERGASPRATLAVASMAKAAAYLSGRDYVIPEDIRLVYIDTVAHRLLLKPEAAGQGRNAAAVLDDILKRVPMPEI